MIRNLMLDFIPVNELVVVIKSKKIDVEGRSKGSKTHVVRDVNIRKAEACKTRRTFFQALTSEKCVGRKGFLQGEGI